MINTFRVKQNNSAIYTATLKDETGAVIPLTQVGSCTLTLYNIEIAEPATPADNIINSRSDQNVKNVNNVTIHTSSGLLTWSIQPADNPIIDETKLTELHMARFDFSYGSPTKYGSHQVQLRVENLRKVS